MFGTPALSLILAVTAAPTITQVVVFPDRAQVTRRASVACGAAATLRFEALPPAIEAASLRAVAHPGTVVGLRYEEVPLAGAFSKARDDAEAKLRELLAQDAAFVDTLARTQEAARLADAYGQVTVTAMSAEAIAAPPLNTAAWQTAFDLNLSTRLKAAEQRASIEQQRRALADQIAEVRRDRKSVV